jgi:TPR repeat protein
MLYRSEHNRRLALAWFERAAQLSDADANLEIAKIYIEENQESKARRYLKRALRAKPGDITEPSRGEAEALLKRISH